MHFIFAGEASTDPSRSLNLSSGWYLVGIEGVFCKLLRSLMISVSSGFGRYPSVSASSFDWLDLARRADFIPTAFCVYWWGFSAQKLPHYRSKTQPISLTKYGNHTGFPVFSRTHVGIVNWHYICFFSLKDLWLSRKWGFWFHDFDRDFHHTYYTTWTSTEKYLATGLVSDFLRKSTRNDAMENFDRAEIFFQTWTDWTNIGIPSDRST